MPCFFQGHRQAPVRHPQVVQERLDPLQATHHSIPITEAGMGPTEQGTRARLQQLMANADRMILYR